MAKMPQNPRGNAEKGAKKTAETVRRLVMPIIDEFGLLLWDVRFVKEGADWFLRVYIDREDTAVSIDDCVNVSRRLSTLLDEVDPIPQSYCLEVSSPGVERELTRPEHFSRFEGYPVVVRLYRARDGVKEFVGLLEGLDENGQLLLQDENENILTFDRKDISAVHVLDDWEDNEDS